MSIWKAYFAVRPEAVKCHVAPGRPLVHYIWAAAAKAAGRRFLRDREHETYAGTVAAALTAARQTGEIMSCQSTLVGYLPKGPDAFFWTDATFDGLLNYYPDFGRIAARSIGRARDLEQRALDRCTLAFYASDWARETALRHYSVAPEKLRVIPFGANLPASWSLASPQGAKDSAEQKRRKWEVDRQIRLLFVGVDWQRKGGPEALEITRNLWKRGVRATLHVVGCTVPDLPGESHMVRQHGFLRKDDSGSAATLERLFLGSHFLIVPSRAECYGLVYAEAMAVGLPPIGRATGGVGTLIRHNRNGALLDDAANLAEVATEWIVTILEGQNDDYANLCGRAVQDYAQRHSWQVATAALKSALESVRR